jgi:hypothetical protein
LATPVLEHQTKAFEILHFTSISMFSLNKENLGKFNLNISEQQKYFLFDVLSLNLTDFPPFEK